MSGSVDLGWLDHVFHLVWFQRLLLCYMFPVPSSIFALASTSVSGVAPVSSGTSAFGCFVGASHPTVLAFILAFESSEHMFASTEVPVLFSFASSISSGSSRSVGFRDFYSVTSSLRYLARPCGVVLRGESCLIK